MYCVLWQEVGENFVVARSAVFLEFPVSEKTLARVLLNNEFESDILKVNIINSFYCCLLSLFVVCCCCCCICSCVFSALTVLVGR